MTRDEDIFAEAHALCFAERAAFLNRACADATQWPLDRLDALLGRTMAIWHAAREAGDV